MLAGANVGAGMGQQQLQQPAAAGAGGAMQATPANSPYGIAPQVFSQDAIQVRHTVTTAAQQKDNQRMARD